jgi:hypothetical protein
MDTTFQLIPELKESNGRVVMWFSKISAVSFFTPDGEAWSASENLDHLIRSQKPIAIALKLPRLTVRAMFGSADQPSRSYEAVCEVYRAKLAEGAVASGRYIPNSQAPDDSQAAKSDLLTRFSKVSADLVSAVERWTETDLDEYLLPHPLIGKLTVREMLYFTIYHNLRHASQEGD